VQNEKKVVKRIVDKINVTNAKENVKKANKHCIAQESQVEKGSGDESL
jgi:hypothetical protein